MSQPQTPLFERWPRVAVRYPWRVLVAAAVVLAIFAAVFLVFREPYADSFSIPGTEAQQLTDLLEDRFPARAGDTATVVVRADAGLDDAAARSRVEALTAGLAELPEVLAVTSPYEGQGGISQDGTIGRITVQYDKRSRDLDGASVDALFDLRKEHDSGELQVEVGGHIASSAEREPPGTAELFGLGAAVIILLISFGSVAAMGLPIITALAALTAGFLLIGAAASFLDMPSFTPQFAAMIGIGVGIDYALLIVTRFREGLAKKRSVDDAILMAMATAGRSVMFAGSAVVIALLGLWAVGIPFVALVGSAAALIVGFAVIVALIVLPAILKIIGGRIERWRIPFLAAPAYESETGMGYEVSRFIQRAPVVAFVLSLGILLLLAVPVLQIRLGSSDSGSAPESFTSRRAYDLLSDGFGKGVNGPILVGFGIDDGSSVDAIEALPSSLTDMDSVAVALPAIFNEERSAALITVIPQSAPQDEETSDLVHDLRDRVRGSFEDTGVDVFVGGSTAVFIDIGDRIESRLPLFFAAVIGLSFILLMAVFRSIVVPLQAALMNILSIAAAYGVLVAIFQWGWLGGVFGVSRTGPVESFLPMMLFAVLFGLSMDYEVFLVSRIKEEYIATGNNTEAVARGLSVTTRVISAAAAIMVAVFLSFALSDQRVVKEFGIGLAVAIFIDATLVRLVLVPSIMQLLGDANWWFPRWLDRLVPTISIEAPPAPVDERKEEVAAAG